MRKEAIAALIIGTALNGTVNGTQPNNKKKQNEINKCEQMKCGAGKCGSMMQKDCKINETSYNQNGFKAADSKEDKKKK